MAIQSLTQLYLGLKRSCDSDLELTVRVLLHKVSDTSVFIREDIDDALKAMAESVTSQKAIAALLSAGAG